MAEICRLIGSLLGRIVGFVLSGPHGRKVVLYSDS